MHRTSRFALFIALIATFLVVIAPRYSAAILMQPGDTVTFKFDAGSIDLSGIADIAYQWTIPGIVSWTGSYSVWDELNDTSAQREDTSVFTSDFGSAFAKNLYPGLFDDHVSYIFMSLTSYNPSSVNSADVSIHLRDLFEEGIGLITEGEPISEVPIPEPGTFILLGGGLAGLAFYRRRGRGSSH